MLLYLSNAESFTPKITGGENRQDWNLAYRPGRSPYIIRRHQCFRRSRNEQVRLNTQKKLIKNDKDVAVKYSVCNNGEKKVKGMKGRAKQERKSSPQPHSGQPWRALVLATATERRTTRPTSNALATSAMRRVLTSSPGELIGRSAVVILGGQKCLQSQRWLNLNLTYYFTYSTR